MYYLLMRCTADHGIVLLSLSLSRPGGETIRQLQVQSGAHVELHRGAQPNPHEKLFNVRGKCFS